MIENFERILVKLESDLNSIKKEESALISQSKKSIQKIRECCKQLSLMKVNYEFKTKQEEIYFFKYIKASFYSKLFYYQDIFQIECHRPNGGDKAKRKFYKEHLYKISEHFNYHRSLYSYYRMGEISFDDKYFTQVKRYEEKYDVWGNIVQCEDDHSSTHDMLFARIMANDLLESFLRKEIGKLSGAKNSNSFSSPDIETIQQGHKKLKWTASKTSLTELVYALAHTDCVNNGKADIKDIAEFVEAVLDIDLGDFYRTYVELRMRTNRTKFLESLKASLIAKMDEDDEKDSSDPLADKK